MLCSLVYVCRRYTTVGKNTPRNDKNAVHDKTNINKCTTREVRLHQRQALPHPVPAISKSRIILTNATPCVFVENLLTSPSISQRGFPAREAADAARGSDTPSIPLPLSALLLPLCRVWDARCHSPIRYCRKSNSLRRHLLPGTIFAWRSPIERKRRVKSADFCAFICIRVLYSRRCMISCVPGRHPTSWNSLHITP